MKMDRFRILTALPLGVILALLLGSAPGAQAGGIPWDQVLGADPGDLDDGQKAEAAAIMEKEKVYYGCKDTIANCLRKDKDSNTARRLAGMVVRKVKAGHSSKDIAKMIKKRGLSMHPFKTHTINLDGAAAIGSKNPKVKVAVFADFECPYCRKVLPRVEKAVKKLSGITLYFKHFPVKSHKHAVVAAVAGLAAQAQGKFWQFHDKCYKDPQHLEKDDLIAKAQEAGVADMKKFKKDMKSKSLIKKVEKDKLEGLKLGVKGTPTVYINGKEYIGETTYADIKDVLQEELDLVAGKK